ncbi:hypothetical protein D9757_004229 [Collybiopsis confluens]|uniref:Thiaminase-2/PQQC domain-containing protein n=1 Tax=Collybiopsis confluens TaxID=2823264 RepID=A0A8H5HU70_9AGAR|nr:hypothetical protein D9757_004229 [Collybiopsis confluens]
MSRHLISRHLISLTPTSSHPFLVAAGNGELDSKLLSFWLAQDRIYAAHAYPKFIGSLIANIPFSSSHGLESPEEQFHQKILKSLLFCLENVVREASFFKDTAQTYKLVLDGWPERKATRDYTAEMARLSGTGNLVQGLVFLWAMEKVYLDIWSSVHRQVTLLSPPLNPTSSAVLALADNWSNPEFNAFVERLAELVDSLDIQPGSTSWRDAENIWERVIELEAGFWPHSNEISST